MTEPTGPTEPTEPTEPTDPSEPSAPSAPGAGGTQPYSYPTPAAADAGAAPAAAPVTLSDDPQPRTGAGRRRTGLLVGGVVTALVLGGAGAFAFQTLSGGGSQPADVLPGDAYAYFRLDIDPSAGQKIAAVRFLGKLPQVKDTLGSDDPRKKLWELASKDSSNDCVAKFSYDTDIAPWLGDRVGAAIRPGGTEKAPNVALAIQVKDEAAAKDTLTRLFACDQGSDTELRMKDGYAIVTPPGVGDATLAAVDKGSLAENATFTADMGAVGEQGVMSAWFDMGTGIKEIQKLSPSTTGMDTSALTAAKGRFAAALRFDADYVELAGVVRGADGTKAAKGDGAELANLPDTTMAALHVSGADQAVDSAWPQLKKQIESLAAADGEDDPIGQIEDQLGITLPDDLKVLLGRSLTVALPDQDLRSGSPSVGGKIVSSDAKRADELIGRLMETAGADSDVLTHKVDGDKVYVATTPAYADTLKAGGTLGDSETFKLAVGDVSNSNAALYVDLDKLEKLYVDDLDGDAKTFVQSLRAVGLNATNTDSGEGTFSLRLVGN